MRGPTSGDAFTVKVRGPSIDKSGYLHRVVVCWNSMHAHCAGQAARGGDGAAGRSWYAVLFMPLSTVYAMLMITITYGVHAHFLAHHLPVRRGMV